MQEKQRGGTDTSKFSVALRNFTEKNPLEGKNTLKTQNREANGLLGPHDEKPAETGGSLVHRWGG